MRGRILSRPATSPHTQGHTTPKESTCHPPESCSRVCPSSPSRLSPLPEARLRPASTRPPSQTSPSRCRSSRRVRATRPARQSKGFFVDLALQYPSLASSGADFQLTGPATHQNQAPFPGAAAPGVDEKLPGLIVLLSTSTVGARNAQNLANLFNLTGFTNMKANEIWDTWIVGAPLFGKNVRSVLRVAVAADKNKDGVYNDAPAIVPDANHDGRINAIDLKAYGVASSIVAVPFQISD